MSAVKKYESKGFQGGKPPDYLVKKEPSPFLETIN